MVYRRFNITVLPEYGDVSVRMLTPVRIDMDFNFIRQAPASQCFVMDHLRGSEYSQALHF